MLPLFLRKFIVDFVETAIAAIFLLNIVFPQDIEQAKQQFVVIGVAVFSALVSALRRVVPDFISWLKESLKV